MHGPLRFVALLLLGTSLVPTHWCCALKFAEPPCCKAQAESETIAVRSCCAKAEQPAPTTRVSSLPVSSDADSCCCHAPTPTVVAKAVLLERYDFPAIASYPATIDLALPTNDVGRAVLPQALFGADLLTRHCRLNC